MSADTRVLIVDDDEFTRLLLVRALASFGYDDCRSCHGASSALETAAAYLPHVAILDLDLGPGPTGIDLAHALRRKQPDIAVIILTSFEDPRLLGGPASLPVGSVYLTKRAVGSEEVLPRAMETVLRSPCADANSRVSKGLSTPLALSDNQVDIMRLVAEGHSNAEIGRRLHLTERGVAKAVSRLVRQLGIEAGTDGNVRVLITQAFFQYSGQAGRR